MHLTTTKWRRQKTERADLWAMPNQLSDATCVCVVSYMRTLDHVGLWASLLCSFIICWLLTLIALRWSMIPPSSWWEYLPQGHIYFKSMWRYMRTCLFEVHGSAIVELRVCHWGWPESASCCFWSRKCTFRDLLILSIRTLHLGQSTFSHSTWFNCYSSATNCS